MVCIILMLVGCVAFSFATGALSGILENYDSKNAKLKEKIATLDEIRAEYGLDIILYDKLSNSIKYDHSKQAKNFSSFI